MKAIMLMFDSLNRLALEPYGCTGIRTPNLQRLADRCAVFDRNYISGFPCMPARRELQNGRYNFLHRSWGPVEPFDCSMPQILKQNGVYTHLISDHLHYWEDGGATYHTRFSSWELARGKEGDHYHPQVAEPVEPEHYGKYSRFDEVNRAWIKAGEEMSLKQIYDKGLSFLENNAGADNWFLQLEAFDPHEPFCPSQEFLDLYPEDGYEGPRFDWPRYARVTEPEEASQHCRRQYAALVTECDYHIGRVLNFMDAHDLWKDTMLIINTDHGFLLGEHGWWAKGVMPLYEEISHTPLLIWDPRCGASGVRRNALVQTTDLPVTLLRYFGCEVPADMHGADLARTIADDTPVHDAILFGMFGGPVNITDGRYVYMRAANETNEPLNEYTLMPTHMLTFFSAEEMSAATLAEPFSFTKGMPVLKVPMHNIKNQNGEFAPERKLNQLYDLEKDPCQQTPLMDPVQEDRLLRKMVELMKVNDAPDEQYDRMNLRAYC